MPLSQSMKFFTPPKTTKKSVNFMAKRMPQALEYVSPKKNIGSLQTQINALDNKLFEVNESPNYHVKLADLISEIQADMDSELRFAKRCHDCKLVTSNALHAINIAESKYALSEFNLKADKFMIRCEAFLNVCRIVRQHHALVEDRARDFFVFLANKIEEFFKEATSNARERLTLMVDDAELKHAYVTQNIVGRYHHNIADIERSWIYQQEIESEAALKSARYEPTLTEHDELQKSFQNLHSAGALLNKKLLLGIEHKRVMAADQLATVNIFNSAMDSKWALINLQEHDEVDIEEDEDNQQNWFDREKVDALFKILKNEMDKLTANERGFVLNQWSGAEVFLAKDLNMREFVRALTKYMSAWETTNILLF